VVGITPSGGPIRNGGERSAPGADHGRQRAHRPGALSETLEAFKALTEGKYDHLPEQAFFMQGGLEDLEKNAERLKKG
jgi:hypothetical protein